MDESKISGAEGEAPSGKDFVASLETELEEMFAQLGEREILETETRGQETVDRLLRLALMSELEAAELAGAWMPLTRDLDAKRVYAAQCGDEMRHFELIRSRLLELGQDLSDFDPAAEGYSPLHDYLRSLSTDVERIAGGPFTSEAIAEIRNAQFIAFCEASGDQETARLYRSVIQPEEVHHKRLGAEYLARHCLGEREQQLARTAMRNTLAIADELKSLTERATGMSPIPLS